MLSDPKVASFINSEFISCWESVRPVPKVTIDFGNGQVLKRTLQGNTVIYLCLPDGRVIDAFPGVYTPNDFLSEIGKSLKLLRQQKNGVEPEKILAWHKSQITDAIKSEKMRTTYSKALVESPLLKALNISPRFEISSPNQPVNDKAIVVEDTKAAFIAVSRKLEDVSKQPATVEQLRKTYSSLPKNEKLSPAKLGERAVQIDSRNNLILVRPAVHLLFANYQNLPFPDECRDQIYKEILHVPIDDPYLGLTDALVPGSPAGK